LIEIIVVITIVGILATSLIVLVNPVTQFQKAQDVQRKSDLRQVQRALEAYYADHGSYPGYDPSTYRIVDVSPLDWGVSTWGAYLDLMPKDPSSTKKYIYYAQDSQTYMLYASLDRPGDPAMCKSGNACDNVPSNVYCGSTSAKICNYGVSSPNASP